MDAMVWFLIGAAVFAVIDWWAVAVERRSVELWAKPLTLAGLIGVAATAGDLATDVRTVLVVAAVFGLLGDIALLGRSAESFLAGLGAFAIGHAAYVAAALMVEFDIWWAIVGVAYIAALLNHRFFRTMLPGARRDDPAMAVAIVVYVVIISAMVVTAWGTAAVLAGVGAMLFALSDWMIGWQRFVAPLRKGNVAVIVTYHVGQALLIIGLATA